MRRAAGPARPASRGAALLTALVIVSVVATIAAGMVWQQWRAVQVETAERARTQSAWILAGALDWARLILREDGRPSMQRIDHLGEPWAVPLAESRLSSFLAAEAEVTEDAPDAFLSGSITDATSKLNLFNLVDVGRVPNAAWIEALQRLCNTVGVSADVATRIASGLLAAAPPATGASAASAASTPVVAPMDGEPPLAPQTVEQLAWLGIEPEAIRALEPYVTLLPAKSLVNANTASREVLAAAIPNLDVATAERLVQVRQRTPFDKAALQNQLGAQFEKSLDLVDVQSSWFEIRGRLRLDAVVLEQKSLVERVNTTVRVVRRERVSSRDAGLGQTGEK